MSLSAFSRHVSLFCSHHCSFIRSGNGSTQSVRPFWAWLNSVFNQVDEDRIKQVDPDRACAEWLLRVDEDRIKQVGPDRACAEWLLRCGASVKWKNKGFWVNDYNLLPGSNFEHYKVEEIDASGSCVMAIGFSHLKGLKHVRRIILHDCRYLYDDALEQLHLVKNTLEFLQLSNCGDISDKGLIPLTQLINLKELVLFQLPEVRDRQNAEALLKSALPKCDVRFTEARPVKEQDNELDKEK